MFRLLNSSMKSRSSRISGFTLLEVLLAVSILAIISTVIYSSLFNSLDAMDRTRLKMDHYELIRMAFSLMEMDIQGAYSSPYTDYYGFQGKNEENDGYPADKLTFISTTHKRMMRNAPETDLCEVEYFLLIPDDDEQLPKLYRRTDPTPDKEPESGGTSWEILDNIKGFDIQYYDNLEWLEQWDVVGKYALLPQAVKITLIMVLEDGSEQEFTDWITVPLRA